VIKDRFDPNLEQKMTKRESILQEVEKLPRMEQEWLIEKLTSKFRSDAQSKLSHPSWEDYAGSAPYPLCGEDAQSWITQSRMVNDKSRKLE
jgi:hypothetical protein